jgi:SAM-dependent methyltransferase
MNAYTIPFRETEDDRIAAILPVIQDADTFVDLGCGNGIVLERIQQKYPHVQCIGIEVNADILAEARRRCPHAILYNGDLRSWDIASLVSGKTYFYMAWTKTYLAEFDFSSIKNANTVLISFKHEIPGLTYTSVVTSTYPFNNVYIYA